MTPDDSDDVLLDEVVLSRAYTLQLVRSKIGAGHRAMTLRLKCTDGITTSFRGGFRLHLSKIPAVVDAIARAYAREAEDKP